MRSVGGVHAGVRLRTALPIVLQTSNNFGRLFICSMAVMRFSFLYICSIKIGGLL